MKISKMILVFIATAAVVVFSMGFKTKTNVNLGEFIKEVTIINVGDNQTQSVIWLPFEFNSTAIRANGKESADISVLKSYLIFMVQCSKDRNDRHVYASEAEIVNRATLKTDTSANLKPLASVPDELAAKLEAIKIALSGSAESAGNMHMLVFSLKDAQGKSIIDSSKRSRLVLTLKGAGIFDRARFVWHTPFDAVADAGFCSGCGEKIKAKWHYCPWCGNKLE